MNLSARWGRGDLERTIWQVTHDTTIIGRLDRDPGAARRGSDRRAKRRKLKDPWVRNKKKKKGKEQNWTTLFDGGGGGKEKSERSTERKIPPTTETRSRPFARPIPLSDLVCMYVSVRVASTQRCGRACHYPPVSAGHPIRKASCWVVVGGIVTIHTLARTCLITEPAAHAAGRGEKKKNNKTKNNNNNNYNHFLSLVLRSSATHFYFFKRI